MRSKITTLFATVVLAAFSTPVHAAVSRTAVSVTGSDANSVTSCQLSAPCRTFAVALGQTTVGGELVALDSGGFGPFTVTQSVSIVAAPGVYAAAQSTGLGHCATINAPAANVILRGLTLNGVHQSGSIGILVQAAGSLHVENCVIEDFVDEGIRINAGGSYFVTDSIIRGNGYSTAGIGVMATSNSATDLAKVTIEHCRLEHNATGVWAYSNSKITVRDSIANANGYAGFLVGSESDHTEGGPAEMMIDGSEAAYNASFGVASRCGLCAAVVYNSHVTENATGIFSEFGGLTFSFGNNTVQYNTVTNGTFGTTYATQ